MGGGFSGGTIDSGINVYQYVVDKPDLQKAIRDPYSLVPDRAKTKTLNSTSLRTVKWDRICKGNERIIKVIHILIAIHMLLFNISNYCNGSF